MGAKQGTRVKERATGGGGGSEYSTGLILIKGVFSNAHSKTEG